jgi:signal transduction histidine kinase
MAIGTIQDITERKVIEEELKTRNDELTNFVYKVSHDLRSPLLSVSGLINLMKTSTLDNEQSKYISLIEDRVKRLDTFIMDILSHSKNLYTDIQIEKINFQKIIDGAFDDLAYLQNTSRISRKVSISKKAFYSDPQRLKDIFRNLISNAIQYIHPSKKINTINIDISISERYASIIIEDNGLGIDKSVCPKIFNMFYRGNELSNGSGIGLYIVNQAVEKIGGTISVESVISQGSKFFITLPNLTDRKGKSMKCL